MTRAFETRVVERYFEHGIDPLPLVAADGHWLSGRTVQAFTHGDHGLRYAAATAPDAPAAIGRVESVDGNTTAVRNGTVVLLHVGDLVYKGDAVATDAHGALAITFIDGTAFNLSAESKMVLDEMVYAPGGAGNKSLLSLVQGSIDFVAGDVAHTGDMKVDTPVATMGIRGTAVHVEIGADNGPTHFSVMQEPNGRVGRYVLYDRHEPTKVLGSVGDGGTAYDLRYVGGRVVVEPVIKNAVELQHEHDITKAVFTSFQAGAAHPLLRQLHEGPHAPVHASTHGSAAQAVTRPSSADAPSHSGAGLPAHGSEHDGLAPTTSHHSAQFHGAAHDEAGSFASIDDGTVDITATPLLATLALIAAADMISAERATPAHTMPVTITAPVPIASETSEATPAPTTTATASTPVETSPAPTSVQVETSPAPPPSPVETSSAPTPTPLETSPTPPPSPLETSTTPTPTLVETSPAPTSVQVETSPAPPPSPVETSPTPTPSPVETSPTPTPSLVETSPTPTPSLVETSPTPTPSLVETSPTPTPSPVETSPAPTPSLVETSPTPTPSPVETRPTPTPTSVETSPAPTSAPVETSSTPTSAPVATGPAPTPTPVETSVAPTSAPVETSTAKIPAAVTEVLHVDAGSILSSTAATALINGGESLATMAYAGSGSTVVLVPASGASVIGQHGTLVVTSAGTFTYAAGSGGGLPAHASVADSFTFAVTEPGGASSTGSLTIVVDSLDRAPSIAYTAASVTEPGATGVAAATAHATLADPDGDAVIVSTAGWTQGADGSWIKSGLYGTATLNATTGDVTYALDPAKAGPAHGAGAVDSFAVTVGDGQGATTTGTASFAVGGSDRAPSIAYTAASVTEPGATGVAAATAHATLADPDGDAVIVSTAGWMQGADGSWIKSGLYGTATLNATTGDVTYALDPAKAGPAHGAGAVDSFAVTVGDGQGATTTGTASFAVGGSDRAPSIAYTAASVTEPGATGVAAATAHATLADPDGDPVIVSTAGWMQGADGSWIKSGLYGTATLNATTGDVTYALDPAKAGPAHGAGAVDSFAVTVGDGQGATTTGTASFAVGGSDRAPSIAYTAASVTEPGATGVAAATAHATLADPDGDAVIVSTAGWTQGADGSWIKSGLYGTATLNATTGDVTYALDPAKAGPAHGAGAVDSFAVTVGDGQGATTTGTASFAVGGSDRAPSIVYTAASVTEAGATGVAAATAHATLADPDGDAVIVSTAGWTQGADGSWIKSGLYGTATLNATTGDVTYALDPAKAGPAHGAGAVDSFAVTIGDGQGATTTGTASFAVGGSDRAPSIVYTAASVTEAGATGVAAATAHATLADPDGDAVIVSTAGWTRGADGSWIKSGLYGTATLNATTGDVTYALDPAKAGPAHGAGAVDSFAVTVGDGQGATTTGTASFAVGGSDRAPSIAYTAASVTEPGATGVAAATAHATLADPDGDPVIVSTTGWTKTGSVWAKVGLYGIATLDIATGNVAYALDSTKQGPAHGASTSDQFAVVAVDSLGAMGTGNAVFTVAGADRAPSLSYASATVVEPGATGVASATAHALSADADGDAITVSKAGWTHNANGTWTEAGLYGTATLNTVTGDVSYALDPTKAGPAHGASADDSFTVTVADGYGATASGSATFRVVGADGAPTIGFTAASATEAGATGVSMATAHATLSDPDHDLVTISTAGWTHNANGTWTDAGLYGTATLNTATGDVSYVLDPTKAGPAHGASATDGFAVTISDGQGATSTGTASFSVNGADHAPTIGYTVETVTVGGASSAVAHATLDDIDGDAVGISTTGWTHDADGTWTQSGTYGTATLNTASGDVSYALDSGKPGPASGTSGSDSFAVAVSDGYGVSATGVANFTVAAAAQNNPISGFTISAQQQGNGQSIDVTLSGRFALPVASGLVTWDNGNDGHSFATSSGGNFSTDEALGAGDHVAVLTLSDPLHTMTGTETVDIDIGGSGNLVSSSTGAQSLLVGTRDGHAQTFVGSDQADTLLVLGGSNTLTGGGGGDTFVFATGSGSSGFGDNEITDFHASSANGAQDSVDLTAFHIANFNSLMSQATDHPAGVTLQLDGGSITLDHVAKASLHPELFHL